MSRRIAVIDGLRGIAILAVIWHHVFEKYVPAGWRAVDAGGFPFPPFFPLSNGWQAVSLFFVLSGFVLMLPYARGDRSMRTARDAKDFYLRRAWRLLPLYVLAVIVPMIVFSRVTLAELARMFTFTFIFKEGTFMPHWNWPLWTLAVEAWFSLLFPLLVPVVRRVKAPELLALCLGVTMAMQELAYLYTVGGNVPNPIANGPVARLPEFVAGMILARAYAAGTLKSPRWFLPASVLLLLGSMLFADLILSGTILWWLWPANRPVFAAGVLLLMAFLLGHGSHAVSRALSWRPLCAVGLACYSLYAWHVPLMLSLGLPESLSPARFLLYVPLLALVGAASYWGVERGGMRLRKAFVAN